MDNKFAEMMGIKSIDELTKVKDFPVKKIEIIKLYLHLN